MYWMFDSFTSASVMVVNPAGGLKEGLEWVFFVWMLFLCSRALLFSPSREHKKYDWWPDHQHAHLHWPIIMHKQMYAGKKYFFSDSEKEIDERRGKAVDIRRVFLSISSKKCIQLFLTRQTFELFSFWCIPNFFEKGAFFTWLTQKGSKCHQLQSRWIDTDKHEGNIF